jgi:hypothetical protein
MERRTADASPFTGELREVQNLLPAALRTRWFVLPRYEIYQQQLVGLITGAGLSLTIAGWTLGNRALKWSLPVAIGALLLQGWLFKPLQRKYEMECKAMGKPE